jgi:threonine/homoserine/homoserine lactone efflux protein
MVAMSQQLLLAFLVFAIVTLFTPGPNNVMLLSSGLNFGVRRTLPHVAGVTIGFAVMVAAAGLGFGAVFATYPVLQTVLKYAGAAYLVYLALVIGLSKAPEPGDADRRKPMTFLGAAAFQWVNVKGWVMIIGTITAYAAMATYPWNILTQAGIFLCFGFLSSLTWALFGRWLQPLVKSPWAVRTINWSMAALLLGSLYPVLAEG